MEQNINIEITTRHNNPNTIRKITEKIEKLTNNRIAKTHNMQYFQQKQQQQKEIEKLQQLYKELMTNKKIVLGSEEL